jgi:ubiquinone/menaquinone biosynthesis C-methylase UbiE
MKATILRTNATPVYGFLSFIIQQQTQGQLGKDVKVLDCGAGGQIPPIAVFSEQGFDAYGIDISGQQLQLAKEYCAHKKLDVDLRKADMRHLPFEDDYFDCVYEHYAMCHLSKKDTAIAIQEMHRITRPGGFCFLGMISIDSFPKSFFGKEKEVGEFWKDDDRHTMFMNLEADELVSEWEILTKEKRVIYLQDAAEEISAEEWARMNPGLAAGYSEEAWKNLYNQRKNYVNYSHLYYILRKK